MEDNNVRPSFFKRTGLFFQSLWEAVKNNYVSFITWMLIVICVLFVVWLFIEPIVWWTPISEVRLYVRAFLIMFAISTFSTLRLYNSIVVNSRFALKLREILTRIERLLPRINQVMESSRTSAKENTSAMTRLSASLKKLSEAMDDFNRMENNKNNRRNND